jgi:hypothetical protein
VLLSKLMPNTLYVNRDSRETRTGKKKRKEKFTLFSDHNGSLPRRQPGALAQGMNAAQ